MEVTVMPKITNEVQSTSLIKEVVSKFSYLSLSDPNFGDPGLIDSLVVLYLFCELQPVYPTKTLHGTPTAILKSLGYVVLVKPPQFSSRSNQPTVVQPTLQTRMNTFWELGKPNARNVSNSERTMRPCLLYNCLS